MSAALRTFIGIPVPALRRLVEVSGELRALGRLLRVTSPESWHLTLKFLGETPAGEIAALSRAIEEVASETATGSYEVRGLGVFPSLRRPSVIWAGLRGDGPLALLAERLDDVCSRFGFARETRAFHPHITLARVSGRAPASLAAMLEAEAETAFGSVRPERVVLYESELSKSGSRYQPLASALLGG